MELVVEELELVEVEFAVTLAVEFAVTLAVTFCMRTGKTLRGRNCKEKAHSGQCRPHSQGTLVVMCTRPTCPTSCGTSSGVREAVPAGLQQVVLS